MALSPQTAIYPMPVVLVGTVVAGRANFMAVGWITRVNGQPPMVAIGINNRHHTVAGILEHGEFSICHPRAGQVEVVDYCGLVSGRKTDKAKLFDVQYKTLQHAPLIAQCPLNYACRLVQDVALPSHHCFIAEIVEVWSDEAVLTDGHPDMTKLDPLLLTMPDNRYYRTGQPVAQAWSVGKALKHQGEDA